MNLFSHTFRRICVHFNGLSNQIHISSPATPNSQNWLENKPEGHSFYGNTVCIYSHCQVGRLSSCPRCPTSSLTYIIMNNMDEELQSFWMTFSKVISLFFQPPKNMRGEREGKVTVAAWSKPYNSSFYIRSKYVTFSANNYTNYGCLLLRLNEAKVK